MTLVETAADLDVDAALAHVRQCECGRHFEPTRGNQIYCSRTCQLRFRALRQRLRRGDAVFTCRPTCCLSCGDALDTFRAMGHPKLYCSEKCGPAANETDERTEADFGSVHAMRTSKRWNQIRAEILSVHDVCGICGESVDTSISGRLPDGPTVDHIVPVARGGAFFDRSNLRLTHRACNQAAAVSFDAEALALARAGMWIGDRM